MERLTPVKDDLLKHAKRVDQLLDTAKKTVQAERRQLVSAEESRELFMSVMSEASEELAKAIRLIAKAVPSDAPKQPRRASA